MTTFIHIITILSVLISIITGIVISWTYTAINRREKGLNDFEKIPFFAKERIIETDIEIESKEKQKNINSKKNKKQKNFILSFNIQEDEPCENAGKIAIN